MEVFIEHLHKVVDGLQIDEVIVADVNADTEVETRVPPVHDLEVTKLKHMTTNINTLTSSVTTEKRKPKANSNITDVKY